MKKNFYLKFTIVNLITFSRVLGSIILPIVYFTKGIEYLVAFVVLLFLTDAIDGNLSRRFKVESFFGGILDSFADKLFAFVLLALLSFEYPGMILVLVLELIIFVNNLLAFTENKNVQTSKLGKFKTIVLDVSVSLMYLYAAKGMYLKYLSSSVVRIIKDTEYPLAHILIGVMIGMELFTIADYTKKRERQTIGKKMDKKKLKSFSEIWTLLIDREFYLKHKDERLKKFLYEE